MRTLRRFEMANSRAKPDLPDDGVARGVSLVILHRALRKDDRHSRQHENDENHDDHFDEREACLRPFEPLRHAMTPTGMKHPGNTGWYKRMHVHIHCLEFSKLIIPLHILYKMR